MYWFWDPTFILIIPALLLGIWARSHVKSTFDKFSRVRSSRGYSGAKAAQLIMSTAGIHDVDIENVNSNNLSDHYDPKAKSLRLSNQVHNSDSIAAIGVAAHEVGHAIQHHNGYIPLKLRNTFVPVASFGSNLAFPLFIAGLIFRFQPLMKIGIIFFGAAVLFHLITLPVEIDASRRAIKTIRGTALLTETETSGAKKVLTAAAMTYVASALMALLNFLRLILLSRR
ncbi:MAG: zinc metallopeptidase [Candidatus Zixiibacteriota bacterium]